MSKKSVGYSQVTGKKSYSPYLGNSLLKRRRCIPKVFFLAILYIPRKWLTLYHGRSVLSHSGVSPPLSNQLISHATVSSHFPRSPFTATLLFTAGVSACVELPPPFSSSFYSNILFLPVMYGPSPASSVSHPKTSYATLRKMSYQHSIMKSSFFPKYSYLSN